MSWRRGCNNVYIVYLPHRRFKQRHFTEQEMYRGWHINITVTEQIPFKHPSIITGWKMRDNEGLAILSIGKLTGFSEWKRSRRKNLCHQMQTSIYAGSRLPGNHISNQECQHWSARSKDTDAANLNPTDDHQPPVLQCDHNSLHKWHMTNTAITCQFYLQHGRNVN